MNRRLAAGGAESGRQTVEELPVALNKRAINQLELPAQALRCHSLSLFQQHFPQCLQLRESQSNSQW